MSRLSQKARCQGQIGNQKLVQYSKRGFGPFFHIYEMLNIVLMRVEKLRELNDKGFITHDQFNTIEPIISGKVVSVFYELRTMLYLGVMLFTTGVGFLIYQNIGQLGHILAIIVLSILSIGSFGYCFWKGKPFSKEKVDSPNPYFDYVLLLGCLLFVSVFGYLEFQFGFLERNARLISLVTAVVFFFFAYRFDHLGILSLAITVFVSFFGIVVSWNGLDSFGQLPVIGLILSLVLGSIALFLEKQNVKPHFTFTYLNFCFLIYFLSTFAGIFNGQRGTDDYIYTNFDTITNSYYSYWPYAFALYLGVGLSVLLANWKKSFLFLLYGVMAGYIATTYFLADNTNMGAEPWLFYMLLSAGGIVYFIVKYRNYFKRTE
jgi:hypothetical protein